MLEVCTPTEFTIMRTANPALQESTFHESAMESDRSTVMTINGTIAKTGILTALLLVAAGLAWTVIFPQGVGKGNPVRFNYAIGFAVGGALASLLVAVVLYFSSRLAPMLAPVYAVCEGLFLGSISGLFGMQYQGIVLQAALLTAGVLGAMLLAYSTGVVRATEKFKMGVIAATGAVCMVYIRLEPFRSWRSVHPLGRANRHWLLGHRDRNRGTELGTRL
jgi:uncharacterized YccA/Bax inhibitor family protein